MARKENVRVNEPKVDAHKEDARASGTQVVAHKEDAQVSGPQVDAHKEDAQVSDKQVVAQTEDVQVSGSHIAEHEQGKEHVWGTACKQELVLGDGACVQVIYRLSEGELEVARGL